MCLNSNQRLSKYKESLRTAWAYTDYNDWPLKYNSIMHLFADTFSYEFLEDLNELMENNTPIKYIARSFSNPARIYRIINTIVFGMKKRGVNLIKQRQIVILLLDIIKEMKYGSEFNESGKNIIMDPSDLEKLAVHSEFTPADEDMAREIQKFCGIIWAYTEAIFFRAHDLTKEIHGPYNLDGYFDNLIVRQYLNLSKSELWEGIRLLPCSDITIYTDYNDNIDVSIDAYNHLYMHNGNYIRDLRKFRIEIDGKQVGIPDLNELIPQIIETIENIHRQISSSDWKTITRKYADIYWYRKKPLRDLLRRDWKVPESVIQTINDGEVNEKMLGNLTKQEIDMLISTII